MASILAHPEKFQSYKLIFFVNITETDLKTVNLAPTSISFFKTEKSDKLSYAYLQVNVLLTFILRMETSRDDL